MNIKEIVTDAIKYWEPRRLVYNGVLALIVAFYAVPALYRGYHYDLIGGVLGLFVLAIIANVLYCAAYAVDVFIQLSDFRDIWRKLRWIILVLGITLASIFTWVISRVIFMVYEGC